MVRQRTCEQAYCSLKFGEGRLEQGADVGGRQAGCLPERSMAFFKLSKLIRAFIRLWRYPHYVSHLVALLKSH